MNCMIQMIEVVEPMRRMFIDYGLLFKDVPELRLVYVLG